MTIPPRPDPQRPGQLRPGPSRLGKGLAALLGETAMTQDPAASGVRTLPIDLLDPSAFQPRGAMDPTALAELADSIRIRGILQPLLARPNPADPGRFQIIAGERRWRAAALAGLHEVPVLVRAFADADAMAAALVENLQRQDLNALEEAEGYHRLLDEFGLTQETLAVAVGKSRSHISNILRLLTAAEPVKAALRSGAITAGHARALIGHLTPDIALASVIDRGLSVRQTEELAAHAGTESERSRERRSVDPDLLALERDLSERLGLRVDVRPSGRGGMLRIRYQDLDQLDGLITLLRTAGA